MIALTSAALFTPLERIERPVVLVEDGFIAKVATRDAFEIPVSARVFDFGDASLAPGFVDLHIHGAAGYDVMRANASGLAAMEQMLEHYSHVRLEAKRRAVEALSRKGKSGSHGTKHVTNEVTEHREEHATPRKEWSGREDLNLRPPGPEPGALPG